MTAFEWPTAETATSNSTGNKALEVRVRQIELEEEARAFVNRKRAVAAMNLPPARESYTLASYRAEPKPDPVMRIEAFQGERQFAVLVSQFKVGKTTLTANLARSFADDKPFLDTFVVVPPVGRVGFFNGEMDAQDFEQYLNEAKIRNDDRVAIWNLRGHRIDLLSNEGRDAAANWLRGNEVDYWILDPWASVCAWSGVDEERNPEVAPLVQRVLEIAELADVENTLIVHHSGWDGSRARGATALPSYADAIWQYTADDAGVRELHAFGRGIPDTRGVVTLANGHLTFTGQTRRTHKQGTDIEAAVVYVREHPGVNKTTAYAGLPFGRHRNAAAVKSALDRSLLLEQPNGSAKILSVNPDPTPEPTI